MTGNAEDAGTLAYLEDTATAGRPADHADRHRGHRLARRRPLRRSRRPRRSSSPSSSIPGNGCFTMRSAPSSPRRRRAGSSRPGRPCFPTRASCRCCGRCFPDHPNLLPAFFEDDPNAAELGTSFVRKPLYSREGANVTLVSGGVPLAEQEGPYGAEGFIRQALAPLPNFSGPISGARKLAGRSHAVRPVDPRGRKPDHRQQFALPAARDFVRCRASVPSIFETDSISKQRRFLTSPRLRGEVASPCERVRGRFCRF